MFKKSASMATSTEFWNEGDFDADIGESDQDIGLL